MNTQAKNKDLNYFDPAFSRVSTLFVLSFENEEDRTSFLKYYTPKVEIKVFSVLTDGKSLFDVPIQKKYIKKLLK